MNRLKVLIASFLMCLCCTSHAATAGAEQRIASWQALIDSLSQAPNLDDSTKLQQVNDFFNQLQWVSDELHWGQRDYWATPLETLETNGGDCEDFAIAKYFTLRMMGVSPEKLRIEYVKAVSLNQAHMVLTYYAEGASEPLILDNLNNVILPASSRPDLIPVYSFNLQDLWLSQSRKLQPLPGRASALKAWEDTKERMQARGEFFTPQAQ